MCKYSDSSVFCAGRGTWGIQNLPHGLSLFSLDSSVDTPAFLSNCHLGFRPQNFQPIWAMPPGLGHVGRDSRVLCIWNNKGREMQGPEWHNPCLHGPLLPWGVMRLSGMKYIAQGSGLSHLGLRAGWIILGPMRE